MATSKRAGIEPGSLAEERDRRAEAAPGDPRSEMPPWVPRLIIMVIVSLGAAYAVWWLLIKLRSLILWLVIAMFLSFALEPAVNWLTRRGWRRGLATAAVLFALIVLVLILVGAMVPLVVGQVQELVNSVPKWLDSIGTYTDRWFNIKLSSDRLLSQLRNVDSSIRAYAANIAGNLLGFGAAILSAVFQSLTILLFTFYLVADGPRVRRTVCSLMPRRRQREVLRAWEIAIDKTGGYLYSRMLLGTISGVCTFIVLTLLGIPFAVPLALWMGFFSQFIPVVGTYIAMAVPLLVAVLEDPIKALWLLAFFAVYQQIENYFLSPRITGRTMELHPAVAFGAALAGGFIQGPIGAFLALPAAAIIQAGASSYITRHEVIEDELTREVVDQDEARELDDTAESEIAATPRDRQTLEQADEVAAETEAEREPADRPTLAARAATLFHRRPVERASDPDDEP
jgi:predicted PurR-regulated permease PerM